MSKNAIKGLIILFLILGFVTAGFAQRQTGSLAGTVLDDQNNPLPGASVIISGPSLLGTNTYLTTQTGSFRFPVLLPGTYELRVEMPGFKTQVRPGLVISVGRTTEVEIVLEQATVEEEITVTAASPVVDIESSKMSTNYSASFLTSMPMSRDLYDIQNSIPGAISEGVDYRRTSSILGGTVRSQLYALDGVPLNDPATWYSMVNINSDVYEEIEFEVGAHPAEVGQTDSTYVNIVTKSGSNKFSGGAFDWLTPFSVVTAIALLSGYVLLSALWLIMKGDEALRDWAYIVARYALIAVAAFILIFSLWTPLIHPQIAQRWFTPRLSPEQREEVLAREEESM